MEVISAPVRVRDPSVLPTKVVAKLARTTPKAISNMHYRGFVPATSTMLGTRGISLAYSFTAAVAARVAADYARSSVERAGGALKDIRGVLVLLAKSKTISPALPPNYVVVTDGKQVFFEGSGPFESPPGRWAYVIPLGAIVAEVTVELERMNLADEDAA